MNIVFRTDSSSEIGYGHLMRCLVLAKELKRLGFYIHFICRNNTGSAHQLIKEAGHKLHLLNGKTIVVKSSHHSDWLGCSQRSDVEDCNAIIEELPLSHVIVDHYGLDQEWESQVVAHGITVIDDLADRHHECNILIDQSLIKKKRDYERLIDGDFHFWGGANVILRDEFRKTASWQDNRSGSVMICMGGADPQNVTTTIVKTLTQELNKQPKQKLVTKIDVVVGEAFDSIKALEQCRDDSNLEVVVHRTHPNLSGLMTRSDICILSCGTMILEACALGAPSLGVVLAENQRNTADYLSANNAVLPFNIESLIIDLEHMLRARDMLTRISERSKVMVDKYGAIKIARAIADEC